MNNEIADVHLKMRMTPRDYLFTYIGTATVLYNERPVELNVMFAFTDERKPTGFLFHLDEKPYILDASRIKLDYKSIREEERAEIDESVDIELEPKFKKFIGLDEPKFRVVR